MILWIKKKKYRLVAILFWLIVWQIVSTMIGKEILFASPMKTVHSLLLLIRTKTFWNSIFYSCSMIALGFFCAVLIGSILAIVAYYILFIREIISFLMQVIKSIPVASFVILALLWVNLQWLPVLMSFLMVLPVFYFNVLKGILATDKKLLEMADVFQVPIGRRIRYIYLPALTPYFISACSVGLGFCWKSGVAAEVIGRPTRSIGNQLYKAKLYLLTSELFAWTFVIVILSAIFEKLVMYFIQKLIRHIVPEL